MPTVRADIKHSCVFPAPRGEVGGETLRLFPAEQWEERGGEPGLWRVSIGECWVTREGEKISFYGPNDLGELFKRWALAAIGLPEITPDGSILPGAEPGTLVWCEIPGEPRLATRTKGTPFQDRAGDWRVYVYLQPRPVPLAHLRLRRRGDGTRG